MGRLFGTDGIRGIVGKNLTVDQAFKIGQAVATVLEGSTGKRPMILIGKDTRISSDMLECALIAGICSVGGNVLPLGVIPTPGVAYLTVQEKADAGIVISASHNPYEYNGIKVFNGQGYKLSDEMELLVEEMVLAYAPMEIKTGSDIGKCYRGMKVLKQDYIRHLRSSVSGELSGLRVLVDCANGAASATAPELFARLPLQADFINMDPDGTNINDHCGSTHMDILAKAVVAGKYDLGIAFDGDADRCLLVDERGGMIDGDKVMAVCGAALRERGELTGNTIVATVMSNLGLHEFCRNQGIDLVCTAVGDRNVLEKMVECDYAIGGEQSGHTIFRAFATTGDGQLTALQFLQVLVQSGKPASELVACCAQYPQVLVNVAVDHTPGVKERLMAEPSVWALLREKEELLNGEGRILLRPSGTEALIRVMVEAKTTELAQKVADDLADYIKELSNRQHI